LTQFNLEPQYEYKLNSMPRGKNSTIPITNSCNIPHRAVTVDFRSNCLICTCDGWLPVPVGTVEEFDSLEAVWNSARAKIIQQDIADKKYTWCAVEYCGVTRHNQNQQHASLSINIDDSCNLACPSCRRERIMIDSGPEFERKLSNVRRILTWLEKYQDPITITLSGNGDPLASHVIRPLFKEYRPRDTQKFILHTNGLLMRKQLAHSTLLSHIHWVNLSVDAGTDKTYQQVRRGGSWPVLLDNFEFLKEIGLNTRTTLKFAVQQNNYQDLDAFVSVCQQYGFHAHIHQLDDWGTWIAETVDTPDTWTIQNGTFQDHNVLDRYHPNYSKCREILLNLHQQYQAPTVYIDNVVMGKL
jgi:pyruvate-formate lyase-activating enzyme